MKRKRDFQEAVVSMPKALIADMEDSCEKLDNNECLPRPSAADMDLYILDPGTLQFVRLYRNDVLAFQDEQEHGVDHREFRHAAYRDFVLWQYGRLAPGQQRPRQHHHYYFFHLSLPHHDYSFTAVPRYSLTNSFPTISQSRMTNSFPTVSHDQLFPPDLKSPMTNSSPSKVLAGHGAKISTEAANLIANIAADWPEAVSVLATNNRTVNTYGREGHGKLIVMLVEHFNNQYRRVLVVSSATNMPERFLWPSPLFDEARTCCAKLLNTRQTVRHTTPSAEKHDPHGIRLMPWGSNYATSHREDDFRNHLKIQSRKAWTNNLRQMAGRFPSKRVSTEDEAAESIGLTTFYSIQKQYRVPAIQREMEVNSRRRMLEMEEVNMQMMKRLTEVKERSQRPRETTS
ncbi:Hypp9459 [Branchiostoma lanceolatum]|uniref:Hypp9459 protein n=1 Tax=Branchiostoma lanceolatum TaxID=7740 RepID=A0A8S4MMF2_BRALA|nr:Hypp9459 [Branchiostoma lanceolatum]